MHRCIGICATINDDDEVRFDADDVDIGLELSKAYNLVVRYILSKRQNIWDNESKGSHLRIIEKSYWRLIG